MTVLITGINGFIGSHLAKYLLSKGFDVMGLGRAANSILELTYFQANVLDYDKIKDIVSQCDIVIHLAALTSHEEIIHNKYESLKVNLIGTANLLEAFVAPKSKGEKFIFSSTGKVYGEPSYLPLDEKHSVNPLNILGKSKYLTERVVDFFNTPGKSFTVLRLFNVYGPGQKSTFLIPTILNQLAKSPNIYLGDVKAKRDYIFIEDVLGAFNTIIKIGNKNSEIFNVGSGKSHSAEEIVQEVSKLLGYDIHITSDASKVRNDEFDNEYCSCSKLEDLDWELKFNLSEGLKKTIPFYIK